MKEHGWEALVLDYYSIVLQFFRHVCFFSLNVIVLKDYSSFAFWFASQEGEIEKGENKRSGPSK
jgi:hypothetical protein